MPKQKTKRGTEKNAATNETPNISVTGKMGDAGYDKLNAAIENLASTQADRIDVLKDEVTKAVQYTKDVAEELSSRLGDMDTRLEDMSGSIGNISKGTERSYPTSLREYAVKSGDSMTLIAKGQLGQAGRFTDIAILNYDRYPNLKTNPNQVQVGWKLRLPD